MRRSESEAIRIRNLHQEIFRSTTQEFRGNIIHFYGDGTLSTFTSAVEAVKCGISLQRQFRNSNLPVRIGIHMADIVITEDDIIGDGVNVASRIESLAVAGSVLISNRVHKELINQDDIDDHSLGYFRFKNISQPMEVFAINHDHILVPDRKDLKGILGPETTKSKRWISIAGTLLVVALSTIAWFIFSSNKLDFPERGWLVVSDIENLTNDSLLNGSLEGVLISSIQQSGFVNVFP